MKPNRYDLRFLEWYNQNGYRLFLWLEAPEVWTHGDRTNPFKVTLGMIRRLEAAKLIKRIFPAGISIWEERFALCRKPICIQ